MKLAPLLMMLGWLLFGLSGPLWADEEALDLEEEKGPPTTTMAGAAHPHGGSGGPSKFQIMGRVDLAYENNPFKTSKPLANQKLVNNHFLVFLNVTASSQVRLFGEIIAQTFYEI